MNIPISARRISRLVTFTSVSCQLLLKNILAFIITGGLPTVVMASRLLIKPSEICTNVSRVFVIALCQPSFLN